MEYTSKDLAQRFGITNETLRQWAMKYKRHLSSAANPTDGLHRRFTFADLEVLTLVFEMRARNSDWDDIHASLDVGTRGVPSIDPAALMPLESQKQLAMLYSTIEQLRTSESDLKLLLTAANTRADRAEGSQDTLKQQLRESQETIIKLRIKIDELEKRITPPKE